MKTRLIVLIHRSFGSTDPMAILLNRVNPVQTLPLPE